MATPMIVFAFLVIVFSPCLLAFIAWSQGDVEATDDRFAAEGPTLARMGKVPTPLQAGLPERPIGNDFEIRSFPKGISQRRFLLRDTEDAPRVTITQVRAAAVELAKVGGFIMAHELALIAAALIAAGRSVVAAAREAMEAAHQALAKRKWVESSRWAIADLDADEGPPGFAVRPIRTLFFGESAVA